MNDALAWAIIFGQDEPLRCRHFVVNMNGMWYVYKEKNPGSNELTQVAYFRDPEVALSYVERMNK